MTTMVFAQHPGSAGISPANYDRARRLAGEMPALPGRLWISCIIALLLLSSAPACISSEPAKPEPHVIDLPTVLRLARARNLDVKIASERLAEAKANQDSAISAFFPWISPGAAFRRHEGKIQAVDGPILDVDKQMYDVGGTLVGRVEVGDALYKTLAAKQLTKAADEGLETQKQEAVFRAAQGYFELVKAQSLIGVLEEAVKVSQEYGKQVHEAVLAGIAFKGDELRVQSQTERAQIAVRQGQEQRRVAAARLAQALHLDATVELVAEDKGLDALALTKPDKALDELVQQALRTRPELKESQDVTLALRDARNGAMYGPMIPTLQAEIFAGGLGGGTGGSTGNFGSSADYNFSAGWRIGPGGLLDFGRVNSSKARYEGQQFGYEKLKDQIVTDVVEAHTRVQSFSDQIQSTKQNLGTASEALRLTTQRKEFGVGAVLEDIQAQQELTRARGDFVTSVAEFNKAQFALERAVGIFPEATKASGMDIGKSRP